MNSIDPPDLLTREELEDAIGEFSDADLLRLRRVAQLYAIYPVEPDELMQDAGVDSGRGQDRIISPDPFAAAANVVLSPSETFRKAAASNSSSRVLYRLVP